MRAERIEEDDALETAIGVLLKALDDSEDATHRRNLMEIINPIVKMARIVGRGSPLKPREVEMGGVLAWCFHQA
jgi:hypothetical protein